MGVFVDGGGLGYGVWGGGVRRGELGGVVEGWVKVKGGGWRWKKETVMEVMRMRGERRGGRRRRGMGGR